MNQILHKTKDFAKREPLSFILILAIITRLVAVFFAKGFGMHDDHFLYIEVPQSWVVGNDYNNWLPWSAGNTGPQGHSFVYPGINYVLLWILNAIGIKSPDTIMYFMRFFHAGFSLLIVSLGYKITFKLANAKTAFSVGIILAIFWVLPWLSVRTMVEIVAIPFMMLSIWSVIKNDEAEMDKNKIIPYLMSGIWAGIAFSIRFQVAFFILGLGFALLFKKGFLKAVWFTLGFIILTLLTQGFIDFLIWKRPFAELLEYANYNVVHKGDYPNGSWYNYFLVIIGLAIPPVSLMLLWGVIKSWKKQLILFLPLFIFFIFHSYFPNKQERFILPILPVFVILGMIGWNQLRNNGNLKWFSLKAEKITWIVVFCVNFILLFSVNTMYSKRSRVESMLYLSHYQNIHSFMIENTVENVTLWSPLFYAAQYPKEFIFTKANPIDSLIPWDAADEPRFVLFYTTENLQKRVAHMTKILPQLSYETTIEPSFIDQFLAQINPVNKNYVVTIYRNKKYQLEKD